MANYFFDSITQEQAVGFTDKDTLYFFSGPNSTTTARNVTVSPTPAPNNSASNATDYGTTLTVGTKSVAFVSSQISGASQANHLIFADSSSLEIGTTNGDTTLAGTGTTGSVIYGLAGDDTITTTKNGADYIYGGTGDDTITGQNGNYHIYGNAAGNPTLGTGQTDVDNITVGTGSNYIQANQGNDTVLVNGDDGYNRIFGGGGDDKITINGTIDSIAAVNGNKGNDTIIDNTAGNNTLRGGQGDDTITQTGASHDVIQGDLGDDTIKVSGVANHVVILSGGDGKDTFDFSTKGAGVVVSLDATDGSASSAKGSVTYYQEITDFTSASSDKILLPTAVTGVGTSTTTFASVSDAQVFAQTQLTGTINVSALTVGTASSNSTFLFYHDNSATTVDGVIHLDAVAASAVVKSFFG